LKEIGINIEGVSKRFGKTIAVDNVSLKIYRGELFSILNPNGAGKTLGGFIETGISILITIIVGIIVFGAKIMWNPFNPAHLLLISLLILGELSTIGIGLIISIFAKSGRGASGIASAIAWPLMMLTEIVLPKWLLPPNLKYYHIFYH